MNIHFNIYLYVKHVFKIYIFAHRGCLPCRVKGFASAWEEMGILGSLEFLGFQPQPSLYKCHYWMHLYSPLCLPVPLH